MTRARSQALPSGSRLDEVKAAIKRFCPPGNGGTEGGVKTIEAMTRARSQALPSGSSFDEVKDSGASHRQLERLTGVGRGLIQKL